ncbi:acyl-ACP--UDP-N-acetylglucosamine O-acyltransferase [Budvicia aquatica]|uniref:acyl-ACP--UDP-N-acetylglucosamine O-acyltransferase n=1 Tax=Budvicia aquatica TaxID=82979 RepID=UPI0020878111|nr:acyl-ACP--UDP-N-acetylglucosamine O-acyltransferase [Budvicia aquatica]GKX53519.1 acyl-[acyl-carrier-protein]--UDP-N-acetylglucosamine O-acyltransferase [Budvicia aquatica]
MSISSSAQIGHHCVIESGAIIGAHVRIGPFCTIAAGVDIGDGTMVGSHSVINGLTRLGRDNMIGPYSSIGEVNQDLKYANEATGVVIGDRNRIGKQATIHRGTLQGNVHTVIGHDNHLLNGVHIGHDCLIGDATVMGDHSGLAGHVNIDEGAQLGLMCAVHQFCIVGAHARIADQSCVVQDVPPFVCAIGNRAFPLGINSLSPVFLAANTHQQQVIRTLYDRMYQQGIPVEDVKKEARRLASEYPLVAFFHAFFSRSTRGIIR